MMWLYVSMVCVLACCVSGQVSLRAQLTAAADVCELSAFIQRVGTERVTQLFADMQPEEARRFRTFISQSLALEAAGWCRVAQEPVRDSIVRTTTPPPIRTTTTGRDDRLRVAVDVAPVRDVPQRTTTTPPPTRSTSTTQSSRPVNSLSSMMSEVKVAMASCRLTAYVQRMGSEGMAKLLGAMQPDQAGRFRSMITDALATEAASRCRVAAEPGRVTDATRPPQSTRPTEASTRPPLRLETSLRAQLAAAADACQLSAFVEKFGRERLAQFMGEMTPEEATKFRSFISEELGREALGECA